jgi:cytochrome P450
MRPRAAAAEQGETVVASIVNDALSDGVLAYPFVEDGALDVSEAFKELQQRGPIRIQLPIGPPCWLATRYDDVRTIFVDKRFSRVEPPGTDTPRMWPTHKTEPTMPLGMDPPDHIRIRRITSPVFSPKSIRALTDDFQHYVDDLLDGFEAAGPGADFVQLYAWDLPILVLTHMLGVPSDDAKRFRHWVESVTAFATPAEERMANYQRILGYIGELISARRERHHDDLLGMLVSARDEGDRLTEPELINTVNSLVTGGFETTASQLGSSVFALMTHRHLWEELVDGRASMDAAIEELWRWIPGFRYGTMFVRFAKEDIELSDGVVIPAGEAIVPEQNVANRDESVFPNGWELDFHRADPKGHLALGFGEHLCMGIHLAKIQVQLTLETMVRRFPTLELAVPAEQVAWPPWTFMRMVESLPLKW